MHSTKQKGSRFWVHAVTVWLSTGFADLGLLLGLLVAHPWRCGYRLFGFWVTLRKVGSESIDGTNHKSTGDRPAGNTSKDDSVAQQLEKVPVALRVLWLQRQDESRNARKWFRRHRGLQQLVHVHQRPRREHTAAQRVNFLVENIAWNN